MAEGQTSLMQYLAETSFLDAVDYANTDAGNPWLEPVTPLAPRRDMRRDTIRRVVQADILPRLCMGHTERRAADPNDATGVKDLVEILLGPAHDQRAIDHIERAVARGLPAEHIYLRLFQPAARRLGELWSEDLCSFVDVTLGMGTLQAMLRRLAPAFQRHGRSGNATRSIVLATLPGDQHTFGVNMAAEFFRRSGWDVCMSRWKGPDELAAAVRLSGCKVVGISASGERRIDELATMIVRLRRSLGTYAAGILVGGPVFAMNPTLAGPLGADAVGLDARQAVAQAEALAGRAGSR